MLNSTYKVQFSQKLHILSHKFFKQNFIWNVFWQEIKLLFKVEAIRFYGLDPSFSEVYYPATVPVFSFLMQRIRWDPLPQLQCFWNFSHAINGPWIETDGNLKAQDQDCMLGVVEVWFLSIPEFLSWLFLHYGVSHCPAAGELYFGYLMLGITVSISWTHSSCWE